MTRGRITHVLLLLNAVLLGSMIVHSLLQPDPTHAQAPESYPVYIEPGYTTLRSPDGTSQQLGKVIIDLRNGNVWGFPTGVQGPYPLNAAGANPPVSRPMYLGKFSLSDMDKRPGGSN